MGSTTGFFSLPRDGDLVRAVVADGGREELADAILPLNSEGAALEAARLRLLEAMLPANSVGAKLDARLLLARLP